MMPDKKWVSTQISVDAHKKIGTAAINENKRLEDYLADVLEKHAEKLDVIIRDSE